MTRPSVCLIASIRPNERLELLAEVLTRSNGEGAFDVIEINGVVLYLSRAQTEQLYAKLAEVIALPADGSQRLSGSASNADPEGGAA